MEVLPWLGGQLSEQRFRAAMWFFLLLGVLARSVRYFLCFPLWEDECFLVVNYIGRGYTDLLGPLEPHQVAPILYLWVQLSLVKVLGFNEYALRLLSFVCGLGSLFLFRHFAEKLLRGTALLFAVAVFSVGYPGIRYAAEAKSYGVDLLVSLVLMTVTLHWWQQPGNTRWLWGLAALTPVAFGMSYPAVFLCGGLSVVVAFVLWTSRPHHGWLAWGVYNVVLLGSFTALLLLAEGQSNAELDWMRTIWARAFPPVTSLLRLAGWLVTTHTGAILAYPFGGRYGGSTLTFLCIAAALFVLVRSQRFTIMLFSLAPLAFNMVAAAMGRYPYGGHVRFGLYMGPVFCVLAGLGGASILRWLTRSWSRVERPLFALLTGLAMVAVVCIGRDVWHPYIAKGDLRARSFAEWFWFNTQFEGEVVCLKTDLDMRLSEEEDRKLSLFIMYLCNQRIYSPRHAAGKAPRMEKVSADWPVRYVRYRAAGLTYDEGTFAHWLDEQKSRFELVGRETYEFPRYSKGERELRSVDYLEVYKFVP